MHDKFESVAGRERGRSSYNQFMGGVDRSDELLSYYGFSHRTVRRVVFHLLDMAIVNSYVLYSSVHTGRRLTHEQFRIELANELLLRLR